MATLTITTDEDFREGVPALPANITEVVFAASTPLFMATSGSNQFGGTGISNNLALGGAGTFAVKLLGGATSASSQEISLKEPEPRGPVRNSGARSRAGA